MVRSPRAQIDSLARALSLLRHFTQAHPDWSVGELAAATEMSKGGVSKILATFLDAGFVVQDPSSRRYRLGPATLAAGQVAAGSMNVSQVATQVLDDLATRTGETAMLVLRAGWRSVVVAKTDSSKPVRMSAVVGRYASLHTGASNKPVLAFMTAAEVEEYVASPYFVRRGPGSIADRDTLLAHLRDIRQQGVAWSVAEVEEDVAAVGSPVFDAAGTVVGAISIAGPAARIAAREPGPLEEAVKGGARELTRLLGWLLPWPPDARDDLPVRQPA